jgi:hypothetical protein
MLVKLTLALFLLPFAVGAWYDCCEARTNEQMWLDQAIARLRAARLVERDPERVAALTYCIERYNKVGGFNVTVLPCFHGSIGVNVPLFPGLQLDPCVLEMPIRDGAVILLHESQHDFWPYVHPLVDERMKKLGCL